MGNFITDFFATAKEKRRQLLYDKATKKIKAIGEVTLESMGKVDEAKLAVDKLDSMQFDALPEKNIYLEALEKYADLKAKEVSEMIEAIESIKKITIDNSYIVKAAKQAYDMLDADTKQKVDNYSVLSEAEKKVEKMLLAEEAVKRLNSRYDEVAGITWYKAKSMPVFGNRSYILPYIGKRDYGRTWMKIRYHYYGSDWIFYNNIIIVVDGKKYYKSFYKIDRDNGSGYVWESVDDDTSDIDIIMLKAIAKSEKTIVRFNGDRGSRDIVVPTVDKQGIKYVLEAYENMK